MASVPLIQFLESALQNVEFSSTYKVNQQVQEALTSLLRGVPLRYSCPLPLFVDSDRSAWTRFQDFTYERVLRFLVGAGKFIAEEYRALLRKTPAEQFEEIFVLTDTFPRVIVYPYYASGDMYGVGASMVLDERLRLRIVGDNSGRKNQAGAVKGFLSSFLPNDARISEIKTTGAGAKAWVPAIDTKDLREQNYLKWLSADLWKYMEDQGSVFFAVDLFFGTNYVALRFRNPDTRRSVRAIVRRGWGVHSVSSPAVKALSQLLKTKGFKNKDGTFPRGKHVVVLWVRFTGKTGGAHVEYDTSFEGLRQLLRKAYEKGNDWVIIVGDKPKLPKMYESDQLKKQARAQKITQIMAESPIPTVDLTEFWAEETWKQNFKKRVDQFKVFELLHYHNYVKHLGARSGNLESLALLGYQVSYFEDTYGDDDEALDKKRMEPWHDTVGYRRIQISQVPTRSGKYMISSQQMEPKWVYPMRLESVKFKRTVQKPIPTLKDRERLKKDREKIKPRLIQETFTVSRQTNVEQFLPLLDSDKPVLLFDIRRHLPPVIQVQVPLISKGFSQLDLIRLGEYLKPDLFYKNRNPL